MGVDVGLAGLQRCQRVVEVLLRSGVLLHERLQAIDVLFCFQQIRLGFGQVGFGLQQRYLPLGEFEVRFALGDVGLGLGHFGLIRAQIENVQRFAGAHRRADLEQAFFKVAVHAAADPSRTQMNACASCRWIGSTPPGAYSTVIIETSLPGSSVRSFDMSGVTLAS